MAVTPTIIIRYRSQQPKIKIKAKKKKVPNKPLHCSELSKTCIVFKELKDYSDKHPVTKIAVLWSLYFENAEADFIREILMHDDDLSDIEDG